MFTGTSRLGARVVRNGRTKFAADITTDHERYRATFATDLRDEDVVCVENWHAQRASPSGEANSVAFTHVSWICSRPASWRSPAECTADTLRVSAAIRSMRLVASRLQRSGLRVGPGGKTTIRGLMVCGREVVATVTASGNAGEPTVLARGRTSRIAGDRPRRTRIKLRSGSRALRALDGRTSVRARLRVRVTTADERTTRWSRVIRLRLRR